MSEIGNIYGRYREALDWSTEDFEAARRQAMDSVRVLYDPFLRSLVRNYGSLTINGSPRRAEILRIFREQFNEGQPEVSFTAIDGTCGKEQLSEMMVFYGASYAQNGTLSVDGRTNRLAYSRWTPSEDTSFVAYLPIPLNSLSELQDEDWLYRADDEERATAVMVHTGLMQLAEIFLAYKRVTSEDRPPHVLLLDHSLSSTLLSSDVMHLVRRYRPDRATLGWIGAYIPRWGRIFEPADALVAHAHPMERSLDIPSFRRNAFLERIVAEMSGFWQLGMTGERDTGRPLSLSNFSDDLRSRLQKAVTEYGIFEIEGEYLKPSVSRNTRSQSRTIRQRWYDLRLLFEDTCEQLFRERRLDALQLTYPDDGERSGRKWMDDNDVRFLVGIGLRLLIEICWQKRVLLLGIAKDSASRYFFKNFLSVVDACDRLSVPRTPRLMGTDRTICEMLALVGEDLTAPWSTIEFDAVFMTLRALLDSQRNQPLIQGVRGDVVTPSDGLILRSLVQFFLNRRSDKATPLMGHVLFMDRISYPYFDAGSRSSDLIETVSGSQIQPVIRLSNREENAAQEISVLIADFLTRNLFPEAIGQPDPLHRADLGAKALGKQIKQLVHSSLGRFQQNPLAWSFRDTRAGRS